MITVLTGENSFALRLELKRLVDNFSAKYSDMGVERLDGEEDGYDRVREALESLPFLASRKLVLLASPAANKEFAEKAGELLAKIPETTDVIIVEPKPDKRTSYYKTLDKAAEIKEFRELDDQGLAHWVADRIGQSGGNISPADARYLVQRAGTNQRLLSNELDKLLNYNLKISRQTIDLLVEPTPQSNIFNLLDAALSGDAKRAVDLYAEQRAMREEPLKILAMLAWQLHILAVVKTAGDGSRPGTIAKEARINPYVVQKAQRLTRRMSLPQLRRLVRGTLELDVRLKSQPIDADEALQNLLFEISRV